MKLRIEYLIFLVPILLAVGAPLAMNYEDGHFINQKGGAVPITDISPENLARHEDDFVIILEQCTHESGFWFQKGADEFEYYPIIGCDQSDTERFHLIAILSGDPDDNWEDIESGKLDFWSGRLVKGFKADYEVHKMLKRSNLDYDEDQLWTLKIGVTPQSVERKNKIILIAVWCVCIAGFIALVLLIRNRIRKEGLYTGHVKLVNVLNDQVNQKYHLIVDILKGHVSKQDDFVVNKTAHLKILRTEEYWDHKKDKNLTKLIIDKQGAGFNWKSMINKQFGIIPHDNSLD